MNDQHPTLFADVLRHIAKDPMVQVTTGSMEEIQAPKTSLSKHAVDCAIALMHVPSFQQLHQLMTQYINDLGFSDYAILRSASAVGNGMTDILTTLPDKYIQEYQATWQANQDPFAAYAVQNTAPALYSDIKDSLSALPFKVSDLNKVEAVQELYKRYDIDDVLLLPMDVTRSGNVTFMLVMKREATLEAMHMLAEIQMPQLQVMASIIAAAMGERFLGVPFRCKSAVKPFVNSKPLRVLMTLANNDFNISQVANNLHISVVTANKHLEYVRKTFGVKTNYAAIKRALREGYIEYH